MSKSKKYIADESDSDSDESDSESTTLRGNKKLKYNEFSYNCKLSIFVFVIFIIITSDVFVDRIMGKSNMGLVSGRTVTRKGLCAQGLALTISVMILSVLITSEKI